MEKLIRSTTTAQSLYQIVDNASRSLYWSVSNTDESNYTIATYKSGYFIHKLPLYAIKIFTL